MRLQLKQIRETGEGQIFDIFDKLTIGRHSDNDIVIRFENVSRNHCLIYIDDEKRVFVKDLDSANGTFVNNEPIDRIQVQRHDILRVGPEKFTFIWADESETFKGIPKSVREAKSLFQHPYFQAKITSIHIQRVDDRAQKYHWPVNTVNTIGRMQFSDIWLDDASVSRQHAVIDIRENRVLISDSSSTNGTFVNEQRITQQELHNGNMFSIGKKFQFSVSFEMDASTTLTSLRSQDNLYAADVEREYQKLLDMFKKEYGEQTMVEVERQTTLFYEEFGQIWKATVVSDDRRRKFLQLINLFAKSSHVLKGTAFKTHVTEHIGIEGIGSNLLKKLNNLLTNYPDSRMVYFEVLQPELQMQLQTNGIVVQFHTPFEIMVLNISPQNLAYFLFLSGYLPRLQNNS